MPSLYLNDKSKEDGERRRSDCYSPRQKGININIVESSDNYDGHPLSHLTFVVSCWSKFPMSREEAPKLM